MTTRPPGRPTVLALTLAVLAASVAALVGPPAAAAPGRPAVHPGDAADPFVLRRGAAYHAFTSGRADGPNLPVLTSTDLVTWTAAGDALPALGPWARGTRARSPGVVAADGGFLLFYTATDRASGRQCIGRARAATATGPFVDDRPQPFVCQPGLGGSINPYPFRDRDGRLFLYWANDGSCCLRPVSVWGQRLDEGGRRVGEPQRLLRLDRRWELPRLDNPAMVVGPDRNGTHRLFYSTGWWATRDQATGQAHCAGPLGPCGKVTTARPWHDSTPHAWGPGGAAFFTDTAGRNWMAHHGWPRPGSVGYGRGGVRALFIEKVDLGRDGARVNPTYPYAFHRAAPHPYVDVPAPFTAAVAWAHTGGVVTTGNDGPDHRLGGGDGLTQALAATWARRALGPGGPAVADPARPGAPLTRGAAARLLHAAAGAPDVSDPAYDHPYVDVGPALDAAVRLASFDPDGPGPEAAPLPGRDDRFRPAGELTRAQWLRALHRLLTPA